MAFQNLRPAKPSVKIEDLAKKQLNLYPYKHGKLSKKQITLRLVISMTLLLMITVTAFTGYTAYLNMQMSAEIAVMKANLQVEQERLANQRLLDDVMKRIDYKSELLKYIDDSNASAVVALETIEEILPNEVKYINLSFVSENAIRISCSTSKQEWIAQLVHQLKAKQFFDSVFVESIALDKESQKMNLDGIYVFELICTFGGNADEIKK